MPLQYSWVLWFWQLSTITFELDGALQDQLKRSMPRRAVKTFNASQLLQRKDRPRHPDLRLLKCMCRMFAAGYDWKGQRGICFSNTSIKVLL